MKLYYHPVSTTSRPVVLFATESGIDLDYQIVDLFNGEQYQPEYAAINPSRQVPVLEVAGHQYPKGEVLDEVVRGDEGVSGEGRHREGQHRQHDQHGHGQRARTPEGAQRGASSRRHRSRSQVASTTRA